MNNGILSGGTPVRNACGGDLIGRVMTGCAAGSKPKPVSRLVTEEARCVTGSGAAAAGSSVPFGVPEVSGATAATGGGNTSITIVGLNAELSEGVSAGMVAAGLAGYATIGILGVWLRFAAVSMAAFVTAAWSTFCSGGNNRKPVKTPVVTRCGTGGGAVFLASGIGNPA